MWVLLLGSGPVGAEPPSSGMQATLPLAEYVRLRSCDEQPGVTVVEI
ncbi:MAG: hypothetical protein RMK29_05490 [Myxococcales bacterium]|nr:hypothetical protein [Myxococcota bacterium]MDW8281143.1 hypothetical protein [Myxococcales bacterium]